MALSITRECMLYEDCVNKGMKIFSYEDMHDVISFDRGCYAVIIITKKW